MKAAVTGGTGFLGAVLIDELLANNWCVSALARDRSRLRHADKVRVVEGDLQNQTVLNDLASDADIFFHLAGVTHAHKDEDYFRVNVEGAKNAALAAGQAGAKIVHASSMSAKEPSVSPYAESKFESEAAVESNAGAAGWIALRLPAIYGPGDMATLPYFKLIKSGLALEPKTASDARASIIYVSDAAKSLVAAAEQAPAGAVYEVGDENADGWAWKDIGQVLGGVIDKKPRRLRVPKPVIAAYHGVLRPIERGLGRAPSVRAGQVNEFFHPDWVARSNLLSDSCSWRPGTPLAEGFAKTVRWYQEQGLL